MSDLGTRLRAAGRRLTPQRQQVLDAVGSRGHATPEQIVEWFGRLHAAGCDGVQVNFYDYLPDLEFFGKEVLPLMKQAGLRS